MNNDKDHEDVEVNEPVLDGAEETPNDDVDPRKGQSDPALIRHPEKGDKTVAPYNLD